MKKFESIKILYNGIALDNFNDSWITYLISIENEDEFQKKVVVVPREKEKLMIDGIEIEKESNVLWCEKKDFYFKVTFEKVLTFEKNLNLNLLDERKLVELKGDELDVAFQCKNLFPEASMFHHELLNNPNLSSEMKKWFKLNMTNDWFIKNFNENMKDKEILSYFKAAQVFSELENMYELLISKKQLESSLHLEIIIQIVKKTETLQSLERFFNEKRVPINILMDAMLSFKMPESKKRILRKFIDEEVFDK